VRQVSEEVVEVYGDASAVVLVPGLGMVVANLDRSLLHVSTNRPPLLLLAAYCFALAMRSSSVAVGPWCTWCHCGAFSTRVWLTERLVSGVCLALLQVYAMD
jgi:hypothetical protein